MVATVMAEREEKVGAQATAVRAVVKRVGVVEGLVVGSSVVVLELPRT